MGIEAEHSGDIKRELSDVMPFVNIRDAEARQIEALSALFRAYGLPIPENTWPGRVPRFGSVHDACEAGIVGERANAPSWSFAPGTKSP